jgi:hypothetical protein
MEGSDQRAFKQTTISVNTLASDCSELDKFLYFYYINFSGKAISSEHKAFVENKIKELSE